MKRMRITTSEGVRSATWKPRDLSDRPYRRAPNQGGTVLPGMVCRWKGHREHPDPGDAVFYCTRCKLCVDLDPR